MIRVTVEVVPGGDEARRYPLETFTIVNASTLADISDYEWSTASGRHGVVYSHRRSTGWGNLVRRALQMVAP